MVSSVSYAAPHGHATGVTGVRVIGLAAEDDIRRGIGPPESRARMLLKTKPTFEQNIRRK